MYNTKSKELGQYEVIAVCSTDRKWNIIEVYNKLKVLFWTTLTMYYDFSSYLGCIKSVSMNDTTDL